jgi:hypothetical protein
MPAMNCPNCGLENPPSATRCDCGFDFDSRQMSRSFLPPPSKRPNLNLLDSLFLVQGRVIDIAAVFGVFGCVALMAWIRSNLFDFPLWFFAVPLLGMVIGLVMKAMGRKSTSIIRSMLWTSVIGLIFIVFMVMGASI